MSGRAEAQRPARPGLLRRRYGSGPLHLIAVIASLAITAYALSEILAGSAPLNFVLWFALAIIAHDLIAFPLYSLLGLIAGRALRSRKRPDDPGALNYVRAPALISALLLLVWFPLICQVDAAGFLANTGLVSDTYLERWLLLTAALFAASGVLYALRLRSRRRS